MRGSLVKICQSRVIVQELALKQEVASTVKSYASLAWFDPISCSLKTSQQSLVEDLSASLPTLPRSGMTRSGFVYELPIVGRTITETDGSYWLTPRVVEIDESVENFRARMNRKRPNDRKNGFASLSMQVKAGFKPMWPTPTANEDAAGTPNGKMQTMLGNHPEIRGTTPEQLAIGTLNPTWVEWLMGFPIGFTDSKAWVMPRSRSKQQ
jgi:hypothetical protein